MVIPKVEHIVVLHSKYGFAIASENGNLFAEGSTLELPYFPFELEYLGIVYTNPAALVEHGETYAVKYTAANGKTFTVYND